MNWSYFYRHWFGTLIISPIIAQIYELIYENNNIIFDFPESFFAFLFVGLILSAPTYIFYGFIFHILKIKKINLIIAKIILIVSAVIGIITTFTLIGGSMSLRGIIFYSISSIITGIFFKLNSKKTNDNNKSNHKNKRTKTNRF